MNVLFLGLILQASIPEFPDTGKKEGLQLYKINPSENLYSIPHHSYKSSSTK